MESSTPTSGENNENYISEDLIDNTDYYKQLCESEMLLCSICLGLLNDPIMCETCQNSFCRKCLDDWEKKHLSCPFKCEEKKFVPISRSLRTLLDGLIIKCDCGCGQKISLLKFPQHREQNKKIECFNCGTKMLRRDLKIPISKNEIKKSELLKITSKLDPSMLKDFNSKISFLIYVEANNIKGFITVKDNKLYLTKYKPEANHFSVCFYNQKKYLQCFLFNQGWRFVEPHYDRGVLVSSSKPSDSIDFDFEKGTITSNSGRTKGSPLTIRVWDYCFYFYNSDHEVYIPVIAMMVPYENIH